jgi:hypothetical protein
MAKAKKEINPWAVKATPAEARALDTTADWSLIGKAPKLGAEGPLWETVEEKTRRVFFLLANLSVGDPIPEWVRKEFAELFGPLVWGKRRWKAVRHRLELPKKVVARLRELQAAGESINRDTFRDVAKKEGTNATYVGEFWSKDKAERFHEQHERGTYDDAIKENAENRLAPLPDRQICCSCKQNLARDCFVRTVFGLAPSHRICRQCAIQRDMAEADIDWRHQYLAPCDEADSPAWLDAWLEQAVNNSPGNFRN